MGLIVRLFWLVDFLGFFSNDFHFVPKCQHSNFYRGKYALLQYRQKSKTFDQNYGLYL
jgi:hypothetical protein